VTATWVVLLRGINVGGHRPVPMARLRDACERAGLADVRTYIASGNLVCTSTARSEAAVANRVATTIEAEFGFSVDVVVRAAERIAALAPALPDVEHLHVGFLWAAPGAADVERVRSALLGGAEIAVEGDHLQLCAPNGLGRPFLRGDLERLLGVGATLRSWRTVKRLAEMVG
jgi:uncharacterized protein (DUF1697 family)